MPEPDDDPSAEPGGRSTQHRFPPHVLREYALLADGQRGAVCGPQGEIVWMCAPRWHDDAVLSALLGGPGVYAITPVEPAVWGGYYEDRSLIWRNRWVTTSTIVHCREALAYPGDPERLVLLRRVEAGDEDVRLRIELDVRPGFGAIAMREHHRDASGTWTARAGDLQLRWQGAGSAVVGEDGALRDEIHVPAGGTHEMVLELSPRELGHPADPATSWRATENAWQRDVPDLAHVTAARDAQHAHAVLRGLTPPSGGMVAAATMSLPERAEQGRNFDYRYAWLRDYSYAGIAVAQHGPDPYLAEAVSFVTARLIEDGDRVAPAYTVDGAHIPDEQRLDLPGYPGGQKVIKGNWVTRQSQLDVFGEVLQLLAAGERHGMLDRDGWRAIRIAVRGIEQRWDQPEAGIWELGQDWWTHSRLSCVAGLRATAAISPTGADSTAMLALADAILAETSRLCLHPHGYWQRSPHHTGPDASLLLPPVRGALPADDPRTRATVRAVRTQLAEDGYVYRFPQDPHPLGDLEGAFVLCGFVLALAEWQQGAEHSAVRRFERNRASCGPPGLFSEEYDVVERQLRGNLPQAFVHAMLLEVTAHLAP